MGCLYTIEEDGKQIKMTLTQLTEYYFKSNASLKNTKIFSSEDLQNSTLKEIKRQLAIETKDALKKDKSRMGVIDLITKTPPSILKLVNHDKERFAPDYNEDNRIIQFIIDGIERNEPVPTLSQKDPDLRKYMKKEALQNLPDYKINYYLTEIKDIIAFEEKTKIFGYNLHKVLSSLINVGGNINHPDVKQSLNLLYKDSSDILDKFQGNWEDVVLNIASTIYKDLSKKNVLLSEVSLGTLKSASAQVKGDIDIIAIDQNGTPHIYDIKISKKAYEDWDSAKMLTTDYQLAIYRQLLGQYTSTDLSTLNLIPIQLSQNASGEYTMHHTMVSRSAEQKGLEGPTGYIYNIVRKIIPNKINLDYDPNRIKDLTEEINSLFPDYKFRTARVKTDPAEKVQEALRRELSGGGLAFYNDLPDIEGLPKGYVTISEVDKDGNTRTREDMLKELEEKAILYTENAKADNATNVAMLRNNISKAMSNVDKNIHVGNDDQDIVATNVLKNYVGGEYRILNNTEASKELINLGIILLENISNNKITAITISAHNQLANYKDNLSFGDVEYVKAFALLNKLYKELKLDINQIEDIVVYNIEGRQVYYKDLREAYDMYAGLMTARGLTNNLSDRSINSLENTIKIAVRNTLISYSSADRSEVERIFDAFYNPDYSQIDLEKLQDMLTKYVAKNKGLIKETATPGLIFSNEQQYLFAQLQSLLLAMQKYVPTGDFAGMKTFGIGFADLKHVVSSFYSRDQQEYDKNGKKILGPIGGLMTITPDKVGSKDIRNITTLASTINSRIGQLMYKQSTVIAKLTRKFYDEINYSVTNRNLIGRSNQVHKDMWVDDPNSMRTKNPYASDPDNAMGDSQREYLKAILFEINKYKLGMEDETVDVSSMETLTKHPKIITAIKSGKYFEMPLMRTELMDRHGKVLHGGIKGIVQNAKEYLGEIYDFLDPRELTEADLEHAKESQLGLYEMYDVYDRQNDQMKGEMIAKKGRDYFEWNLDTIAHRYAFSKIKKAKIDLVLPTINAYIWWMKLTAGKTNTNISKELDYIVKQLNLSIYDAPIVDPEYKDAISAVTVVKRFTAAGLLAFRPVLMVKELTLGLFKGFSLASTKMFGKELFGAGDLQKALGKLLTIDKKFSTEWNLIDGINNHYRFANMDINTVAKKLQTDRRGIFMGLGRWMYAANTIPDYYNRLALFLAKMIHDGCYDAHYMEDGLIKYDPRKDERFKYYLENRSKHVDSKGNYIPAKDDLKYNTQRNLYNLLINELNKERIGEDKYTENDLVDQAYSERERTSFKTITDTSYGYYDKDSQAQWHNTAFGIAFLQFMQFWPGKMHMWFGKPTTAENSPTTRIVQKYLKDEKGKPVLDANGNKILLWKKPIYSQVDPDEIIGFEEVPEETGDPAMVIEGSPQEGLIYALGFTIQGLARGEFKSTLGNSERMARVYYALAESAMMMLLFGFITALLKGWIAENGSEGIDGNTMQFMAEVSKRVTNESNVYQNTIGALNSEPAFVSYMSQIARDAFSVFKGNKTISAFFGNNFHALELWDVD